MCLKSDDIFRIVTCIVKGALGSIVVKALHY